MAIDWAFPRKKSSRATLAHVIAMPDSWDMDEAVSSVFAESYRQVLDEIDCGELRIQEEKTLAGGADYLCTVGLTGSLQGYLVLSFSGEDLQSFSHHLNRKFEMGQIEVDKAFMRESLAELANQLSGRSVMGLSGIGIDCLITPPTVISGKEVETSVPHLDEKRLWRISTQAGVFYIAVLSKKR
jgi:chemotaxis protein CheX